MPKTYASTSAASISALTTPDLLRSYLASTVTYNNNAVLADTALSVTVEAGAKYKIELVVFSSVGAQQLKLDFGGTATITNFIGVWYGSDAGGVPAIDAQLYTDATADYTGAVPADGYITLTGSVEINAAGTFLLRGAQNSASPTNTTILRGSTLILTKMS